MGGPTDILTSGTGSFAARILFDLAATMTAPVSVAIAGRNAPRAAWMRTAATARAAMFGRAGLSLSTHALDIEAACSSMPAARMSRTG